jgi:hypothetical protein
MLWLLGFPRDTDEPLCIIEWMEWDLYFILHPGMVGWHVMVFVRNEEDTGR